MRSEVIVSRLERVLERKQVRRVRTVALWLLNHFYSKHEYVFLSKLTNPCLETYSVTDLRDALLLTGLFTVTTEHSELKWKLYPTITFKKYLDAFREAKDAEHPTRIEMHSKIQEELYILRTEVDQQMRDLARNIIEHLDPPFTEEKCDRFLPKKKGDLGD